MASINPAAYQSYVGDYEVSGIRATVSSEGGELFVLAPPLGPHRVRLFPSAEDRFFLLDTDMDLTFVKDARGNVTEVRGVTNGQTLIAKKVTPHT